MFTFKEPGSSLTSASGHQHKGIMILHRKAAAEKEPYDEIASNAWHANGALHCTWQVNDARLYLQDGLNNSPLLLSESAVAEHLQVHKV